MRLKAVWVFVAALLIFSLGCQKKEEPVPASLEGRDAPSFALSDVDGNLWRLSDLKGSVVLINFWASWCPPCKEEMPSLQILFEKTMDTPNFTILSIIYKDDPMAAYSYAKSQGYAFPVLNDPQGSAASDYGLTGVPETFFIDKNGIVRTKVIGPIGFDSPRVLEYIQKLLEE